MKKILSLLGAGLILSYTGISYATSCNDGEECFQKGFKAYMMGDIETAKKYGEISCKQFNYGKGCFGLGYLYEHGEGFPKDMNEAIKYFKKSIKGNTEVCNQGNGAISGQACYELGYLYKHGYAVEKNTAKAKELFKKACDLGYEKGCKEL